MAARSDGADAELACSGLDRTSLLAALALVVAQTTHHAAADQCAAGFAGGSDR